MLSAGPMPSTRRPMPPKPPTPAGMPMPPKPMMPRGSPMPKMEVRQWQSYFSSCPVVASAKNVRRCLLMKFLKVLSNSCPTPSAKHVRGFPHFIGPNGVEHSGSKPRKNFGKTLNGGGMPMPPPNGGMPMPPPTVVCQCHHQTAVCQCHHQCPNNFFYEKVLLDSQKKDTCPKTKEHKWCDGPFAAGAELFGHPMYKRTAKHAMLTASYHHM